MSLAFFSLPLAAQTPSPSAPPSHPNFAFTFFAGYPFGGISSAPPGTLPPSTSASGTTTVTHIAIGAGLERHIAGPLSLELTLAVSQVKPPYGYFNFSSGGEPVPRAQMLTGGATLYSADLTAMLTAPYHGRVQPYLLAGPGLVIIHIPGTDTAGEGNVARGVVIGAGLKIRLPHHWQLRPEVRILTPTPQPGSGQPIVGYDRFTIGISRIF